jgi:hypothetical protein
VKKALQAIKNRTGMSAERAHREDVEKEEESRERKLVALEQIAAASLRGAVAAEKTAADVHLLRRGFDMFEGNVLDIRRTVEAWYQMVDEEKRQAKAQGAGSDIEDPAEEEGNESVASVEDDDEEEATRAAKRPRREVAVFTGHMNDLVEKLSSK